MSTVFDTLVAEAMMTFGSHTIACKWLYSPGIWLGNRSPIEVASTTEGFKEVIGFLHRIQLVIHEAPRSPQPQNTPWDRALH